MKNHAHITVPIALKKAIEEEAKKRSKGKIKKIPLWEVLEMYRNAYLALQPK